MEELKNDKPIFAKEPEQKLKKPKWKHYQNELKSDVTKYLHKKLAEKLNVRRIKVPWEKMTANDIMNWPPDIQFRNVNRMSAADANRLQELAKNDQLDFSREFISRLKIKSRGVDELRSEMTNFLSKKLAQKIGTPRFNLPWSKMTSKDIINWPQDMEFRNVNRMNTEELKKIHELAKDDVLDFSPEFISQFTFGKKKIIDRYLLETDVTKYLADKLAKKLNVTSIDVPWSEMKAGDIINLPREVKFQRINLMNKSDLKRMHELAKIDLLDFSPEFLKRWDRVN
jgi:hypothetical protein